MELKEKFNNIIISKDLLRYDDGKKNSVYLMNIIHIFMPIATKEYSLEARANQEQLHQLDNYIDQFKNNENKILTSFCKFLITVNQKIEKYEQDSSNFKFLDLFEVIKLYKF